MSAPPDSAWPPPKWAFAKPNPSNCFFRPLETNENMSSSKIDSLEHQENTYNCILRQLEETRLGLLSNTCYDSQTICCLHPPTKNEPGQKQEKQKTKPMPLTCPWAHGALGWNGVEQRTSIKQSARRWNDYVN